MDVKDVALGLNHVDDKKRKEMKAIRILVN